MGDNNFLVLKKLFKNDKVNLSNKRHYLLSLKAVQRDTVREMPGRQNVSRV